jgi:iron complex transport system ATP-binding protein
MNRGTPDRGLVEVSNALLEIPPLTDRIDGDLTGRIVRRTCCLYYRTAARRACGDCPLIDSAVVRSRA